MRTLRLTCANTLTRTLGAGVLALLKAHGCFPVAASGLGSDGFWFGVTGERVPFRGGGWNLWSGGGVFMLNVNGSRSHVETSLGARPAFVA